MQIVKHTGWTVDYILNFTAQEINKLATWAYNQEVVDRQNMFAVMQWHIGIQHKKSRKNSQKNLKKALKKHLYNPKKDNTEDWNKLFMARSPKAFDKFYKSLK